MNNLDIQLIVNPSCELVAIDRTSYNNLQYEFAGELEFLQDRSQHVSIEFLCDRDNNVISDSINLEDGLRNRCELLDGNTSVFHFPYDGTFTYYKFLVPHVMHLLKRNSSNDEVFYINGETFFYSGHFYYNNKLNSIELRDFISMEDAIKFIIDNSITLELSEL